LFEEGEELIQIIDDKIIFGEFVYFDVVNKRMFYNKKSSVDFFVPENQHNHCFTIKGRYSCVMPICNSVELCYDLCNIDFRDAFLLIDYIYIDEEERKRFLVAKHDYLITQLYFSGEKTIEDPARSIKIEFFHPSKLLIWIAQMNTSILLNEHFNYTNRGKNIILEETILMNSIERLSKRKSNYFELAQVYQFFDQSSAPGIHIYSFSLYPQKPWPSGACNLTQFDFIDIDMRLSNEIDKCNNVKFRAYSLNYNVLKIVNGLGGLVFSR
jgi:hypothetical protein